MPVTSPADLIRPHARRLYDAGFADGQKALTAALAAVRDVARPRHFSDAPDGDEPQRWFTPEDAARFADYFAADDRGHYPGHLHGYFSLPPRAFADATGLRRAFAAGRWTWAPPAGRAFAEDAAPDGDPAALHLYAAMLKARLAGDDVAFDLLAELAADPDGLADLHADLSDPDPDTFAAVAAFADGWAAFQTKRGTTGARKGDRKLYGKAAQRALAQQGRADRGEPEPEKPHEAAKRLKAEREARRGPARAAFRTALESPHELTATHLADLPAHLETLTRDELRSAARDLQQKVGGKLKAHIVDGLLAHVRESAEYAARKRAVLGEYVAEHVAGTPGGVAVADLAGRFGPDTHRVLGELAAAGEVAVAGGRVYGPDDDYTRPRGEPVKAFPDPARTPVPEPIDHDRAEPSLETQAVGGDPGHSGGRRKGDPHSPAPSGKLPDEATLPAPRPGELAPASGPGEGAEPEATPEPQGPRTKEEHAAVMAQRRQVAADTRPAIEAMKGRVLAHLAANPNATRDDMENALGNPRTELPYTGNPFDDADIPHLYTALNELAAAGKVSTPAGNDMSRPRYSLTTPASGPGAAPEATGAEPPPTPAPAPRSDATAAEDPAAAGDSSRYKPVRVADVDTPSQGALASARSAKTAAWKRIQDLRQRIADEPIGGNRMGLRLELIKAQDAHGGAKLAETQALNAIEKRANELGLTTRPQKSAPAPATPPPAASPLAGVRAAHAAATGMARDHLDAALENAGVSPASKAIPDPTLLYRRLASEYGHLHRRGGTPADLEHLANALRAVGAEPVGTAGAVEPFDGSKHEADTGISTGTPVRVVRSGWRLPDPATGGSLQTLQAKVEPAGQTAPAAPAKPATAARGKVAHTPEQIKDAYDRAGDLSPATGVKAADLHAVYDSIAAMSKAEANRVAATMGLGGAAGDPRRELVKAIATRRAMAGRNLIDDGGGLTAAENPAYRAAVAAGVLHTGEPHDPFKGRPANAPASPAAPAAPAERWTDRSRAAEPPATAAGRGVVDLYRRAAQSTPAEIDATLDSLRAMPADERKRIAATISARSHKPEDIHRAIKDVWGMAARSEL